MATAQRVPFEKPQPKVTVPTVSLPKYRDGFLRADLAKAGDTLTLPGKNSSVITKAEVGYDLNFRRVICIYTADGGAQSYLPNSYIPVTEAW